MGQWGARGVVSLTDRTSIDGNTKVDKAQTAWAGIDVGKTHHWVCVLDAEGNKLSSMKVANDQTEITATIATVGALADRIVWAVDIIGAPSAMLLALLIQAGQSVRYASGRVVAAMSAAYSGEGKTDAKDAYVIAETARIRRDLIVIDPGTDLVRNLELLTGHRADLIADRVRMINRLRDVMTSVFPSLEREFDYSSCKGALVLLTGYASPERLRRVGENAVGRVAATATGAQLRRGRSTSNRRSKSAISHATRPGARRRDDRRARHQHPGPRPAPHRTGRPNRCNARRTPPGRNHSVHARIRSHPRCHTARRCR